MQLADKDNVVCYVARHGETELNASQCFRGNADPPLNASGMRDADRLAKLFEPVELSAIFCSPKQRAVTTAEAIAKHHKLPVMQAPMLSALNVGNFSGTKRTPESEAELQKYIDSPNTPIPGGESLNNFKARIHPCIWEAVDLYGEYGVPPLIVAHSSIVHELGNMFHGNHKSVLVQPGGVAAIYLENGALKAAPILKPVRASGNGASTVS